MGGERSVAECC